MEEIQILSEESDGTLSQEENTLPQEDSDLQLESWRALDKHLEE